MAKHVAASADSAAVKALVPLIAADTDDRIDVVIPDGNPHWTEVVDFVQPPTCRLMFVHAGSAGDTGPDGGPGKTHIVDDCVVNSPVFIVTPNSTGGYVRRFGFAYTQANNTRGLGSPNISGHYNDWNTPQRYREDHCTYTAKATAIGVGGRVIGVVDHCVFNLDPGLAMFLNSWSDSAGDISWAEPTALGSEHFSFLEDNVINVGTSAATGKGTAGIQDSYRGTRFAVRFNDVDRAATQTHPTGGSNRARGSRAFEIYGNKFRNRGPNPHLTEYNVFFGSSGTGMVHHNDAEGYDNFITGRVNRRDGIPYPQAPTPDGWGYAGTTKTGVGSNWDGNQNPGTGYPCLDQLGRGQGDLLVGDFGDGMINQATGKNWRDPGAYPRQALEPIYIFGNIYVGNLWTDGGQGGVIQANRDYFLDTGGRLGKGLVLPTAAGLPWDGFVKLDGGSWLKKTPEHGVTSVPNFMLFVRDSAGVWKPYYQPFEYPHPFIALTKYDDGPIVIPPDPIPVPPDPIPVPPDPTPIPPDPTPVPPNGPPTVRFVKPSGTGPAYEVITDGKVIAVKWQYIKIEADDDVGPVTLEIWIDNSMLDRNSNGEKTLQVKWNTNPHKGRDPVITGKVMDAADQTAECKATVKVRH